MARSTGPLAILVVALALLASADAFGRRELLQSPAGTSTSPSTSPAVSTSPIPAGSTSPSTTPSTSPAAAAAAKPASPSPAGASPSPAQAASSPQPAAAQSPAAAAKAPAAAAQSPASGAQSPAAAAVAPAQAQTPGSAPAPGQPGNTVVNNNNNNNNQNNNVNPTIINNNNNNNNNNQNGGNPAIINNNNNNNNNGQPLPQGATFQPGPGASTAGPAVTGGALVGGPSGGGVSSGGPQGGSSGGSSGSSPGSPGPNNCPPTKDGLTSTEQFLAQVCNPQSARFNGQNIASSLLQNSSGKTDNALICCVACLDSSTCTAWNFQAGGQNAYDGTAPGTCQLVSGTKGASDTLASGSGQPFIGGVLARTNP